MLIVETKERPGAGGGVERSGAWWRRPRGRLTIVRSIKVELRAWRLSISLAESDGRWLAADARANHYTFAIALSDTIGHPSPHSSGQHCSSFCIARQQRRGKERTKKRDRNNTGPVLAACRTGYPR